MPVVTEKSPVGLPSFSQVPSGDDRRVPPRSSLDGEVALEDDRFGSQRHGAEPEKASADVADDRPGDEGDGDQRKVAEHEHELGRHDLLEHAVDRSAENERHECQQEDGESQPLTSARSASVWGRWPRMTAATGTAAFEALYGQTEARSKTAQHVIQNRGPGQVPQSAHDDRLTAINGVAHHGQVAETLEQDADQGEPEQGGAVLGGDGRSEEPFTRADARAGQHDSGPDQPDPELPARPRRLGKIADLPGRKIPVGSDRSARLHRRREGVRMTWRGSVAFTAACQSGEYGRKEGRCKTDGRVYAIICLRDGSVSAQSAAKAAKKTNTQAESCRPSRNSLDLSAGSVIMIVWVADRAVEVRISWPCLCAGGA